MLKPTLLLFLFSCCVHFFSYGQNRHDTITGLKTNRTKPAFYKAPNGKIYPVSFVSDHNETSMIESSKCGEDLFSGKDRAKAKTSFVNGVKFKSFTSITSLISFLTKDSEMENKVNRRSLRVVDEKINARLTNNIFLYAMKKEGDNDYHVIIGDNKVKNLATFLNVEISGVPKSGNVSTKKAIQKVRNFFEKNFVDLCGSNYAVFSTNPIPVTIEGSLFFDIDHKGGTVGPKGFRPKTSWEIHPISKIALK